MAEVEPGNRNTDTGRRILSGKRPVNIDMNPMVDIAFLLLTFFMLATTFSTPQTMEISMPVKPKGEDVRKEQPIKESKALTVVLSANDTIYWFRGITDPKIEITDYSREGIREVLLQKNLEVQGLVVLIKPDETSNFKNLVDILDEMSIAEIGRYAIVDLTPEDRKLITGG